LKEKEWDIKFVLLNTWDNLLGKMIKTLWKKPTRKIMADVYKKKAINEMVIFKTAGY
jgi:hypothetical protein